MWNTSTLSQKRNYARTTRVACRPTNENRSPFLDKRFSDEGKLNETLDMCT